jgi:hypothetical protein
VRPIPTPIYHITHVRNLQSILQNGSLFSDSHLVSVHLKPVGIAYLDLKSKRMTKRVPVSRGGYLSEYVPFYFSNRTPMLGAIYKGYVEGYDEGQEPVIYLCTTADEVLKSDLVSCFTDGHAIEELSDFFENIDDLDKLDWEAIDSWRWKKTDDPDRMRRKQAEFLVYDFFPIGLIKHIGVINEKMGVKVRAILEAHGVRMPVRIERKWYFD